MNEKAKDAAPFADSGLGASLEIYFGYGIAILGVPPFLFGSLLDGAEPLPVARGLLLLALAIYLLVRGYSLRGKLKRATADLESRIAEADRIQGDVLPAIATQLNGAVLRPQAQEFIESIRAPLQDWQVEYYDRVHFVREGVSMVAYQSHYRKGSHPKGDAGPGFHFYSNWRVRAEVATDVEFYIEIGRASCRERVL